jgi:hypothetical protein
MEIKNTHVAQLREQNKGLMDVLEAERALD